MTYKERLALCRTVFNGTLPDGQRMGVFITWSDDGKKWTYRIEGHFISDAGPEGFVLPKDEAFTFGAPAMQEKLSVINTSTSRRNTGHQRRPAM